MHILARKAMTCLAFGAAGLVITFSRVFAFEPVIGQWHFVENVDPFTDEKSFLAGIATKAGLALQFECYKDGILGSIKPYSPLVSLDFITMEGAETVDSRVDSASAVSELWLVFEADSGPSFVWNNTAENFASAIIEGKEKVVFRVHGHTASANLKGAAEVLTKLFETCEETR